MTLKYNNKKNAFINKSNYRYHIQNNSLKLKIHNKLNMISILIKINI